MKTAADGNRFAILDVAIKRQHRRQDALIEVLHTAQQAFGYLDREALHYVARELKLPPSRVFGVATFYKFFTLKPAGKHTCVVCLGTACYVKRSFELAQTAQQQVGIPPGTTTPDGEITLLASRCMGACGIAPVVVYDGTVVGHQTAETVTKRLSNWKTHGHQPAS
jgi:bidirectional [NiFe] hydrogenase diaphorase subunit